MPEIKPWTYPQSTNDSSPCCRGAIPTHSHGYSGTTAKEQSWYSLCPCDYATRYPEAVPLHSIDAEHVAEELVKLLQGGNTREIMTDQDY